RCLHGRIFFCLSLLYLSPWISHFDSLSRLFRVFVTQQPCGDQEQSYANDASRHLPRAEKMPTCSAPTIIASRYFACPLRFCAKLPFRQITHDFYRWYTPPIVRITLR